ncbi:hypothetical protein [Rhodococcus rhodnii]|uniref:hypothetical protein n=1 Tax=Rhodococcus rhodnii TaxID=38312 RepID=UPI000B00D173|nr:hypothetical protein [Rhodococcus rhodnii]
MTTFAGLIGLLILTLVFATATSLIYAWGARRDWPTAQEFVVSTAVLFTGALLVQ